MKSEIEHLIKGESSKRKTPSEGLLGIIYALVVLIGNGIHPIINTTRPDDLTALQFVFLMSLWECCLSIPLLFKDFKAKKAHSKKIEVPSSQKTNLGKIAARLVLVGLIFSLATYLYIEGLTLAGSVSGSIAIKISPIYAMIIGILFLHEKIDIKQIILTILMLGGIFYLGTEGKFQIETFSLGFAMCLTTPLLWIIGHAITKPLLTKKLVSPAQVIFIRSGVITLSIFIVNSIVYGFQSIFASFAQFDHLFFAFLMGGTYLLMHISWYTSIKFIDLSYASALVTPSPIITALLSFLILNEPIESYHIIGMIILFVGLYLMIYFKAKARNKKEKML